MRTDTDLDLAVTALARKLYLHYCHEKGFNPYPYPWAPRWAMDYSRIAVDAYGFDTEGLDDLVSEVKGQAA